MPSTPLRDAVHVQASPVRPAYPDILGPMPELTLACWIDLGLSDAEIARYFGLDERCVSVLTRPARMRARWATPSMPRAAKL
ncbi:hypothetical protein [Acidimangrovimonas sediminis]|uniref:hypothetical protein n=1 Tax=Acidimangrovimonas sediminis TaxID=2056283 RepID=UPI0011AF5589|nr:hypothetical protein [Acidimangrovimonas sediminis]